MGCPKPELAGGVPIYVDFEAQQRIRKLGAQWFGEAARQKSVVRVPFAPAIIHLTWVMLPGADPWDSAALGLIGTERGQT
jgi:hypothetical protein